jgi:broad specificity phosphatase PhoE
MTTIYLVRHAHSDWADNDERPLSASGRKSAEHLASVLSAQPIAEIYSSPYRRSIETVTPLAKRLGLHVQLIDDLRERKLPTVRAAEVHTLVESAWRSPSVAPAEGESNVAAQARGLATMEGLIARHRGEQVVVATHGNLLALIINAFDPAFGFESWCKLSLPDVFRLEFEDAGPTTVARIWEPIVRDAG